MDGHFFEKGYEINLGNKERLILDFGCVEQFFEKRVKNWHLSLHENDNAEQKELLVFLLDIYYSFYY